MGSSTLEIDYHPSKGFCSFLDQLLQNLSWYSLFQVWAQLILLSDLTVSFLENPVPDLCLSDQACPEFTEKKLRATRKNRTPRTIRMAARG